MTTEFKVGDRVTSPYSIFEDAVGTITEFRNDGRVCVQWDHDAGGPLIYGRANLFIHEAVAPTKVVGDKTHSSPEGEVSP